MSALGVVSGSVVKFVYLISGIAPAEPTDENTIYFSPEGQSIFVGSVKIVDGKALRDDLTTVQESVSDLETEVSSIEDSVDDIEVTLADITETQIPNIESRIEIIEESLTWVVV